MIRALPAARPGRAREADIVIVGSGAAGISAALTAAALPGRPRVLMVTKDLTGGATPLAQGGLAAAIGPGDSAAAHEADTLAAGAGLCDRETVAALAAGAPAAINWLAERGARLERRALHLEGGHSRRRVVHAGDATGAEAHRALLAALLASRVEVLDRTVALDLLGTGAARGVWGDGLPPHWGVPGGAWPPGQGVMGGGQPPMRGVPGGAWPPGENRAVGGLLAAAIGPDGALDPVLISARAVVLAAGGLGQAFATTTNPPGATGDALAIAARAGAQLRDPEFVQFHPTVLWRDGAAGQCPLITEALRGAGAVLRDQAGRPLMAGHHPRGDLAPRDVVSARMQEVIAGGPCGGGAPLWLDATALGRDGLENGFPNITAACRDSGVDPVTEFIPVAPGAHYSCGGIRAGLDGRTSLAGLYAVGEAAGTGVHGANRLASNSLTEAVIAGRRAAGAIGRELAAGGALGTCNALPGRNGLSAGGGDTPGAGVGVSPGERTALTAAMSRYAGVLRDREGLRTLVRTLEGMAGARAESGGYVRAKDLDLQTVEATNLHTVSALIAAAALRRAESRGCHRRRDAPAAAADPWHTLVRWDGRRLVVTEEAL